MSNINYFLTFIFQIMNKFFRISTVFAIAGIAMFTGCKSAMTLTTTQSGAGFYLDGAGTVFVNWGDGTPVDKYTIGNEAIHCGHAYTTAAARTIFIAGGNVTSLQCFDTQLTALDVSKNMQLTWLELRNNQLSVLDVSKNTTLHGLDCIQNQLTVLDVSNNTALTWLEIQNNLFDAAALNAMFETLHGNPGTKTIRIADNPGTSTCNQAIATGKGWTVDTTTVY